jgi:hypothetical protein
MNLNVLSPEIRSMIYRNVIQLSTKSHAFKQELTEIWYVRQLHRIARFKNSESDKAFLEQVIKNFRHSERTW